MVHAFSFLDVNWQQTRESSKSDLYTNVIAEGIIPIAGMGRRSRNGSEVNNSSFDCDESVHYMALPFSSTFENE